MLIEVKAKVSWIIDAKTKKKQETFILDKEVFAQAEYAVMQLLTGYQQEGTVEGFEILGLKVSPIKEVITQYQGDIPFVATLRDVFLQDDGTEKSIRYKVLLWADAISEAMGRVREVASQGYNMQIDSLKEMNYTYLNEENNEEESYTPEGTSTEG